MNLKFILIDPTPALWQEMEVSADSNCFFTAAWDDYLTHMHCRRIVVQIDDDDQCIGWFVGSRSFWGLRIISAPSMGTGTYAQGLCLKKEHLPKQERIEIYKQLVQWLLQKKKADYIQICDWQMRTDSATWIDDWYDSLLDEAGIHYNPRHTFYLDLQPSEEELWANLHYKSCKYPINKARKEGLEVHRVEREEDIDAFVDQHYDHIRDVLHRKHSRGLPCQRHKNISALCHSLFPHILMLQVVGKDEKGQEVSMSSGIFVPGRHGSTYFTAASYQRYMSHNPNELMVWEAMRELHSQGAGALILGGVAHYKKKFNPTYAFVPVMIFSRYRLLLDFRRHGKKLYAQLMHLLGR